VLCACAAARAERIKDITTLQGVRSNPVQGFGLVFGLAGTGDNSETTRRAVASALRKQEGLAVTPEDISADSVTSVWISAELPPFAREGSKIDVTVSAIGACKILRGGTLLMTELKGADGQVYAVAQGHIVVGGYEASGRAASIQKNHPTVGKIPAGAHVEREELAEFIQNGQLTLHLRNPDFATAGRIARAINSVYASAATAEDAGTVEVDLPDGLQRQEVVEFIAKINALEVQPDAPAVVVIDEKTGTIIVGQNVQISLVAITKGNLSIITEEQEMVSQPLPFSTGGSTERVDRTREEVVEERRPLHVIPDNPTVQDLARALNAMGLSPADLISIFVSLKEQGALQAELRTM
jgi:flagellar P-ring protein precursor FlgI